MLSTLLYTILSVVIISLVSLIGLFTFSVDQKKIYKNLIYLVSFSAGTLMGDAFIHLIPEAYENSGNPTIVSVFILLGIFVFFVMEKIIHWRHCHREPSDNHPHPFSYMILFGDTVHNFIDGIIIAASFLVSIPLGIASTMAVFFHEIPQEIGDFGSLVYGGFTRKKALFFNFLTATSAILGAILVLAVNFGEKNVTGFLIPFAAGGFIYVAGTDLIPELHKHNEGKKGIGQVGMFILGIGLMLALLLFD